MSQDKAEDGSAQREEPKAQELAQRRDGPTADDVTKLMDYVHDSNPGRVRSGTRLRG